MLVEYPYLLSTGIKISNCALPAPAPKPLMQTSINKAPLKTAFTEFEIAQPKLLCPWKPICKLRLFFKADMR